MNLSEFYSFFPPGEQNVIKAGEIVVYLSKDNVFAFALDRENTLVPLTYSSRRLLNSLSEPDIRTIFTAPPPGQYPVMNMYVDSATGKLVVEYDDLH
jgi:hypothetical protein